MYTSVRIAHVRARYLSAALYPSRLISVRRTRVSLSRFSSHFVSARERGLIDFPLPRRFYVAVQTRTRGVEREDVFMVPRTSASSLGLPECHPGDGPGMKPIFDGVYINQILLQALQRLRFHSFSLSLSFSSSVLNARARLDSPRSPLSTCSRRMAF